LGEAADALAEPIEGELARGPAPAGRTALCFIWREPWMVVGADTYIHDLLEWCGARNLGARLEGRYPKVELAEALALEPEVILLPDEPYEFGAGHRAEFTAFPAAPAVRGGRVVLLDGKSLSWYGPRLRTSLQTLPPLFRSGPRA